MNHTEFNTLTIEVPSFKDSFSKSCVCSDLAALARKIGNAVSSIFSSFKKQESKGSNSPSGSTGATFVTAVSSPISSASSESSNFNSLSPKSDQPKDLLKDLLGDETNWDTNNINGTLFNDPITPGTEVICDSEKVFEEKMTKAKETVVPSNKQPEKSPLKQSFTGSELIIAARTPVTSSLIPQVSTANLPMEWSSLVGKINARLLLSQTYILHKIDDSEHLDALLGELDKFEGIISPEAINVLRTKIEQTQLAYRLAL